ncbi:MAG: hypothetical protein MI861_07790, partial [Pirellulales bacterium]|nr:hypothetical protein [Pirellulales bacterium]
SPRVGDKTYINFVELDHFRYVNNNDIVTRVPPVFFGYRHCGSEVYIDRFNRIGSVGAAGKGEAGKRRDRWKGFWRALTRGKIDHFADHSIHGYIQAIRLAAESERGLEERGLEGEPVVADDVAGPDSPRPEPDPNPNVRNPSRQL